MILLRHGQSEFNLRFTQTRRDPGIPDPELTELGRAQAREAAAALAAEPIARILVSPYRRTLQTAEILSETIRAPIEVEPLVRERYGFSCDIGSPVSALAAEWPQHDFAHLEEIWWPQQEEPVAGIVARAETFRTTMAQHPAWDRTLVVCHWGFILSMTGKSVGNCAWLRCNPAEPAPAEIIWRHH